ncbi:hypothetical protein T08_9877 [Trichinella sp. T8]|nr:hypothetical protein T08_9877 [Trichinella sp. T8]
MGSRVPPSVGMVGEVSVALLSFVICVYVGGW